MDFLEQPVPAAEHVPAAAISLHRFRRIERFDQQAVLAVAADLRAIGAAADAVREDEGKPERDREADHRHDRQRSADRKSTRSELQSLMRTSYAVFCLTKKQER